MTVVSPGWIPTWKSGGSQSGNQVDPIMEIGWLPWEEILHTKEGFRLIPRPPDDRRRLLEGIVTDQGSLRA